MAPVGQPNTGQTPSFSEAVATQDDDDVKTASATIATGALCVYASSVIKDVTEKGQA